MDVNNLLTRALGNTFTGIGHTILGDPQGRYNFNFDWTPLNPRTVWVDVSYNELFTVAQNVPHLNIAISRGAEMFSLMHIRHVKAKKPNEKKYQDVENSPVLEFMKKPNVLRTQEQWLYDFWVYNAIYNNVFVFPIRGLPSAFPTALNILPSGLMNVMLTGKKDRQYKLEQIIEGWRKLGDDIPFKPNEIVHFAEGLSMNGIISASKIPSLQLSLSNIIAGLKSENIILTERGMIGFLRVVNEDAAGSLPPNSKAKKVIEETYQKRRSLDSTESHVGVFNGKTEWVPMTFDMQQLGLHEGQKANFYTVLAAYSQPKEMYPWDGATYENQNEALKNYFNNCLLPAGAKMLGKLATDVFNLQNGELLIPDFSYLPLMQEDKLNEGKAYNQLVLANSLLFHDGIIDADTYAEAAEVERTGTGKPLAPVAPPPPDNEVEPSKEPK